MRQTTFDGDPQEEVRSLAATSRFEDYHLPVSCTFRLLPTTVEAAVSDGSSHG
jgi:hypothetical protein